MESKAEKIALFRYALIAPLVLEALPRGELTRRAQEIAARPYEIPASQRTSVTVDTLLDWALRYRRGGFEALAPNLARTGDSPAPLPLSSPISSNASSARIRIVPAPPCCANWRSCRPRHGRPVRFHPVSLPQAARSFCTSTARSAAHKKFEAEHSNQIWQSDMLYGPYVQRPGGGKMQAYLHAILDDASRLIPHAQFYATKDWKPAGTACARPWPPAACRCGSIWTTPKYIAARNWRGLPPPSACSSSTPRPTSRRVGERSSASSARLANRSWPTWIAHKRSPWKS